MTMRRSRPRRATWALVATTAILVAACSSGATTAPSQSAALSAPGSVAPASGTASAAPASAAGSPASAGTSLATPDPAAPFLQRVQANTQTTVDTSKWKKTGPYVIDALTQGPINGWGTIFDETIKWAATQTPDVKSLQVFPANGNPDQQTKDMENAITQKPDAIILTPMSKAALSAPTERAMAAGIPVILCNSGLNTDQYVTEVGRNLYLTGFESAAHLAQMLGGTGNVVMFNGIAGVDTAETWKLGAHDAFSQYSGIKIVAEQYANWSPADSKKAMEGILASNPQIDGVWSGGSEMAIGAINALSAAGRPMPKFGVTNPLNGFLRLVTQYNVQFWAAPYPPSVAKLCLDYALKVLAGQSVPKYNDVITLWQGVGSIDNSTINTLFRANCNDDYIGPVFLPDANLKKLNFCQ